MTEPLSDSLEKMFERWQATFPGTQEERDTEADFQALVIIHARTIIEALRSQGK